MRGRPHQIHLVNGEEFFVAVYINGCMLPTGDPIIIFVVAHGKEQEVIRVVEEVAQQLKHAGVDIAGDSKAGGRLESQDRVPRAANVVCRAIEERKDPVLAVDHHVIDRQGSAPREPAS